MQNSSNSAFLWVLFSCFALLGLFTSSWGPRKVHLTNSLVSLIVLSFNYQNHKQWLNGAMFLTISPFFVIDDNTIKANINFKKFTNWTTYTCLDAYHHPMSAWPPSKSVISPLFLHIFATPPLYVDLIHLAFLLHWKILSPPLEDTCFDPHLSPFGIKLSLQYNIAQRKSY